MSYQEQLRHPKWQKKRLEILERDMWTCKTCGDTEATLTVHHKSYRKDDGKFVDVWDYNNNDLVTMCINCHSEEEIALKSLQKTSFIQLRDSCQDSEAIDTLLIILSDIKNINGRITVLDILSIKNGLIG